MAAQKSWVLQALKIIHRKQKTLGVKVQGCSQICITKNMNTLAMNGREDQIFKQMGQSREDGTQVCQGPVSQQWLSSLVRFGRGPEKTTESDIVLAKLHTDATLILVTSDWHNWVSLPLT